MPEPSTVRPSPLSALIASAAQPLSGAAEDYDALLELIGGARVVVLGAASDGVREFCEERARLTRRLVAERDFAAVAVVADWRDAERVDRYVRAQGDDADSEEALRGFRRFPAWVWRNADMVQFVDWLRGHNDALLPHSPPVGFYGLDRHNPSAASALALRHIDRAAPESAQPARAHIASLERMGGSDGPDTLLLPAACHDAILAQLLEQYAQAAQAAQAAGALLRDAAAPSAHRVAFPAHFHAHHMAAPSMQAKQYYRAMLDNRRAFWNLRAQHMADTLDALLAHLPPGAVDAPTKIVVWAPNAHAGDARASPLSERGGSTFGQLARQRHGSHAVLIGMTSYQGSVTAATAWDAPAERQQLAPALPGSCEALLHASGLGRLWLPLRGNTEVVRALSELRMERATGAVRQAQAKPADDYVVVRLPQQFDAVVHIDHTSAVAPLD